ncbi:1-acyl-sn-glycerol-3-phosphate acyltransferase [Dermatophilus congolensis]|uniref:1-acyl-sn-glycerol-3-phosphate acyltransferase n=1 Tax=Dermatophilus congolensis TaxID=1863 RepID=UPI001AAEBFE2|nr:1-acyl-sn-glycerol-3-phosphate acyltransferase [Dermatophilus congolensis]MBO3142293.1 acyl-phosphate glycerol 3-phosphate acyltransferase [Dermatophilus congolensis]MBO3151284.1 acyl-phosphate glycerol 3-phosphate acyltransferase [Dermatophilus congolensis]MBO3161712.1 acyl-phosphate glycerol 3-phosphate acyltransferase [Dermatophilus congolensis]MBO3162570.1 acyl-phosphate glycerol 3-phosphate acyltransferase [Dermatophilus congolensis]MBO3176123.1 acyl-phosphate glycerol 3-phosphate acyl
MFLRVRVLFGRAILAVARVRLVDEDPGKHRPFVIVAPHTSYMDPVLLLGFTWATGYNVRAIVEKKFFVGPFDWLFRKLGGIPIDRKRPIGVVEEITAMLADPNVCVVIAPEGTRSATEFWKSGFYRIARSAGVPVTCGFVDMRRRVGGLGPTFELTGDVAADMDRIRGFYEGMTGWRAGKESRVKLRNEVEGDLRLCEG